MSSMPLYFDGIKKTIFMGLITLNHQWNLITKDRNGRGAEGTNTTSNKKGIRSLEGSFLNDGDILGQYKLRHRL